MDPSSYFTVNGETYKLTGGYLDDYGSNPDLISRDYDIVLTSDGIAYDGSGKLFTGKGSVIYLDLNVNSTEKFVGGNFTWSSVRGPNTLVNGLVGISCQFPDVTCNYKSVAVNGTASVELEGSYFIVNFELQLQDGQTAKGYYKGPLGDI